MTLPPRRRRGARMDPRPVPPANAEPPAHPVDSVAAGLPVFGSFAILSRGDRAASRPPRPPVYASDSLPATASPPRRLAVAPRPKVHPARPRAHNEPATFPAPPPAAISEQYPPPHARSVLQSGHTPPVLVPIAPAPAAVASRQAARAALSRTAHAPGEIGIAS